jgi:hypothetical protein
MSEPDSQATLLQASGVSSYGITATFSLPERRLRTLKHGHTFGLFDPHVPMGSSTTTPAFSPGCSFSLTVFGHCYSAPRFRITTRC